MTKDKRKKIKFTSLSKYSRDAIFLELSEFDHLADDTSFAEVTRWENREGYDISIHDKLGYRNFPVTVGAFKAIKKLIKMLDNE